MFDLIKWKTVPKNSSGTQHTLRVIRGKIEVNGLRLPKTARTIEHEHLRVHILGRWEIMTY